MNLYQSIYRYVRVCVCWCGWVCHICQSFVYVCILVGWHLALDRDGQSDSERCMGTVNSGTTTPCRETIQTIPMFFLGMYCIMYYLDKIILHVLCAVQLQSTWGYWVTWPPTGPAHPEQFFASNGKRHCNAPWFCHRNMP